MNGRHLMRIDGHRGAVRLCQRHLREIGRNCLVAQRFRDMSDIAARFRRKRTAAMQMVLDMSRSIIVGREHGRIAVSGMKPFEVGGAGKDIVPGVMGIPAQPILRRHLGIGSGHHLHDSHRAGRRYDGEVFGQHGAPAAFLADDGANPLRGNLEFARCLGDQRLPARHESRGRHRLLLREERRLGGFLDGLADHAFHCNFRGRCGQYRACSRRRQH